MRHSKLPNFMLVGAPKCGTTSLASHLAQHPQIYLARIKEPKFFTAQFVPFPLRGPGDVFVENFTVKKLTEYQRLFDRVRDEKAIGEASVDYLYFHHGVIPLIKKMLGDIQIIIVLRNPVEVAFSAYKNLLRDARETLSFEEGLAQEANRRRKGYEYLWRYRDLGYFHAQVKAYLKGFSRVLVLILEHFEKGSPEPLHQIFEFLKVDPSFKPGLRTRFNASGVTRFKWAQRPFNPTAFKGKAYKFLALRGVDIDKWMGWVESLRGLNIKPVQMKPETRRRLLKTYRPDVKKLERLLKTDLGCWQLPA